MKLLDTETNDTDPSFVKYHVVKTDDGFVRDFGYDKRTVDYVTVTHKIQNAYIFANEIELYKFMDALGMIGLGDGFSVVPVHPAIAHKEDL